MIAPKPLTLSLLAVISLSSASSAEIPLPRSRLHRGDNPKYIPAPSWIYFKNFTVQNHVIRSTDDGPAADISLIGPAYSVHFDIKQGDVFPIGGKLQHVGIFYPRTKLSEGYFGFGELPKTTPPLPVQPISFVLPLGARGTVDADEYHYELTSIERVKKAGDDRSVPTATIHAWPKKGPTKTDVPREDVDALTTWQLVQGDVLQVGELKYDVLNVVVPDAETGIKGWVELGFRKFVELKKE